MFGKELGMEKKLFIFDAGGVIIHDTPIIEEFSEKYGIDFDEAFSSWVSYNRPLLDGFMGPEMLYAMLERKFDIDLKDDDILLSCYHPETNVPMKEAIAKLRSSGHRCVTGSNTYSGHWDYLKNMDPSPLDGFDRLYASHEIHLSKPDRQFFEYIMRSEGFEAKDTVFIDDMQRNLDTAKVLGMTTFWYHENNKEFREFLEPYLI